MLVRAPYSSGKTSLAQLLQRQLKRSGQEAYIISLATANGESWSAFWFHRMRKSWAEIVASSEQVYIIIDEVQIAYREQCGVYQELWKTMKDLSNSNPRVRFICFGAYGSPAGMLPTPIEFHLTVPFAQLLYTEQEFTDLCERFQLQRFKIDLPSANYLFHITNGYPGIIGWILVKAHDFFKNRIGNFAFPQSCN